MKTLSPQARHMIMGNWIVTCVLLVALTIVYTAFFRQSECLEHYMQSTAEAQQARMETADAERASLAGVFAAINSGDRDAMRKAIVKHYELLQANDKKRAENPIPPFPKSCNN